MSDWEFLHEMSLLGYSQADINDAMACGYAPWEEKYIDLEWDDSPLDEHENLTAPEQASKSLKAGKGDPLICKNKKVFSISS